MGKEGGEQEGRRTEIDGNLLSDMFQKQSTQRGREGEDQCVFTLSFVMYAYMYTAVL